MEPKDDDAAVPAYIRERDPAMDSRGGSRRRRSPLFQSSLGPDELLVGGLPSISLCRTCGTFGCDDCGLSDGESDVAASGEDETGLAYGDGSCGDGGGVGNDEWNQDDDIVVESSFMPSSSKSGGSGNVGFGSELHRRRRQIGDARVARERAKSRVIETKHSAWGISRGGEGTLEKPGCSSCSKPAESRCSDCAPGGIFFCAQCDESHHGSMVIHNRDRLCEETGGFAPMPQRPRTWSLSNCTSCLHAQCHSSSTLDAMDNDAHDESQRAEPLGTSLDEFGDLLERERGESDSDDEEIQTEEGGVGMPLRRFRIVLHTMKSGCADVTIVPKECDNCGDIFGSDAAEYGCTSCATGTDWFLNDMLCVYATMNEAANFSLSWLAMWKSHSAHNASRNHESSTSSATAQKFTQAMRIYTALRNDKRRLGHVKLALENVMKDPDCPVEVKTSLALRGECAACGTSPLSRVSDGSHCIRIQKSAGKSHNVPLDSSVFSNLSLDPSGHLRNEKFNKFVLWRAEARKKADAARKRASGITPKDSSCSRDYKAVSPVGNESEQYDTTMVFMSSCSHYVVKESGNLLVHTKGEGYSNMHFQLAEQFHNSGQRPLPEVFGPVPPVLAPSPAFNYYDLACKIQRTLELTDLKLYELVTVLLGKLHGK